MALSAVCHDFLKKVVRKSRFFCFFKSVPYEGLFCTKIIFFSHFFSVFRMAVPTFKNVSKNPKMSLFALFRTRLLWPEPIYFLKTLLQKIIFFETFSAEKYLAPQAVSRTSSKKAGKTRFSKIKMSNATVFFEFFSNIVLQPKVLGFHHFFKTRYKPMGF